RLVAAPALPLAAGAGTEEDLQTLPQGDDGRDQLQRRTERPVYHGREQATRPARVPAARLDARGRGLLDARAGGAASARLDRRRHPPPPAEGREPVMTVSSCHLPVLELNAEDYEYEMSDYEGAQARWCPGGGDHSILTAVQRLLAAEQLTPENTVFVSGIGCSSRFPH